MPDHSAFDAVIYQIFKGIPLGFTDIFQFLLHRREVFVRVGLCVAMPRKMLHRWQHPIVLKGQRILESAFCHGLRVLSEAAHSDDRIRGLAIHVDVRREVNIHADAPALLGNLTPHLADKIHILNGAKSHLIWVRHAVVDSHAEAPLAVDANHHWGL